VTHPNEIQLVQTNAERTMHLPTRALLDLRPEAILSDGKTEALCAQVDRQKLALPLAAATP